MKRQFALAAICLIAATTNAGLAQAQSDGGQLPPELLACAEETDVARRLACFDREMAKLSGPEPAIEAAPEPAPEPAVAPEPEMIAEPESPPEAPAAEQPAPAVVESSPEPTTAPVPPAAESAAAATAVATAPAASAPTHVEPEPVVESAPPAAAPAATSSAEEDFGLPDQSPEEFSATVTDIARRPYGEMIILLDNGQIWEQKHRDNRFRLSVGEDVTISKGLISGFRLTGGNRNNSIQVERLK